MADEKNEELNDKNSVLAHDSPNSLKRYPLKPTAWQRIKEAFNSDTAIELEAVRKRKLRVQGDDE